MWHALQMLPKIGCCLDTRHGLEIAWQDFAAWAEHCSTIITRAHIHSTAVQWQAGKLLTLGLYAATPGDGPPNKVWKGTTAAGGWALAGAYTAGDVVLGDGML